MPQTEYTDDGIPYFHPIYMRRKTWAKTEEKILNGIKDGLPPKDAFVYGGLFKSAYYDWKHKAKKDIENGVLDSPVIRFLCKVDEADQSLHRDLVKTAKKVAIVDENPKMLSFLLEKRYKYGSKKQLEVSTPEDTNFNINIIGKDDK